MYKVKNPFSGDVSQVINPWQWWADYSGGSAGIINITNYKSDAPETEASIVQEVAGYGMQLGIITKALEAVISTLPEKSLNGEQINIINEFELMVEKINAIKARESVERFSAGGIERFINGLEKLKEEQPDLYYQVADRLKEAL
jgi:hypothetical protein